MHATLQEFERQLRRPRRRRKAAGAATAAPGNAKPGSAAAPTRGMLRSWISSQAISLTRHAAALRPFRRDEFGNGPEAPTEAHVDGVNKLVVELRNGLLKKTRGVSAAAKVAIRDKDGQSLQRVVFLKERAHHWVQTIEKIWDFYFELFGQRQGQYGKWLLSTDRIAVDCYQAAFLGLGRAKSVPTPPPFTYMRTGFSPSTITRSIRMRRLGGHANPFPLIQLPYHRLVNPWTLGAVLHEVSHNLQNDLGLAQPIPRAIGKRLLDAGLGRTVAGTWMRWNRELFADLSGLLLGGPAVVGSLMDVVGRSVASTFTYVPEKPHPTPYLRTLLSVELLRRMGFEAEADAYRRLWTRIYPNPRAGTIPKALIDTFPDAGRLVVDTVCFRPYATLGNKSLSQVIRFERKEQTMIEEAARRLAAGIDPGIVPARFLIGAAREALDRGMARPGVITENFYNELSRR